jgi:dihydrofolate reductase
MGKPVIMGRKTYESIGRSLPGRMNIVVTRDKSWNASSDLVVVHGLDDALKVAACNESGAEEAMVIGGAQIYREALPLVDRVYLTEVGIEPEGDAFFSLPDMRIWSLESSIAGEESAQLPHRFLVYRRNA